MPVDDRLRQGLEANATSFTPHQESRLEQVHRRRRRHNGAVAVSLGLAAAVVATVVVQVVPGWPGSTPPTADDCSRVRGHTAPEEDVMDKRTIVAAVTVATLASACEPSGGTSRNPEGDTSSGWSSATGGPRLIQGRGGYVREVTAEQGRALGVPARTVRRLAGQDGVLPLGFKLEMGNFTIWTNDDTGDATAWDYGTYSYASGHRLVLTTISDRCSSCTTTLVWRTVDNDAVFDQVDRTRSGSLARWLWQGRWDYQAPGEG